MGQDQSLHSVPGGIPNAGHSHSRPLAATLGGGSEGPLSSTFRIDRNRTSHAHGSSRRRPLASLFSANAAGNDENRPQGGYGIFGTRAGYSSQPLHPHPYFIPTPPRQERQEPVRVPVQSTSRPRDQRMIKDSSAQEPRNKMIKLEMNVNPSDGQISGKLVIADGRGGDAAALPALCAGCRVPMQNIATADEPSVQGREMRSYWDDFVIREMNRQYECEGLHLLYKINKELMVEIGDTDCYRMTGLVNERKRLQQEVFHRISRPDIFDGIRRYNTAGILLTGSPNNGKKVMAKLIAKHINRRYIFVRPYYLDCRDAYTLLIAIFRLAAQTAPAAIVFENIDQTFRDNKRLQALFASEFHRSVQGESQTLVIGTMGMCYHNLPKILLDCFEHRLEISLPEEIERRDLINLFMRQVKHTLSPSDVKKIAFATRYYSRGNIEALCRKASSAPGLEIPNEMIRSALEREIRPVTFEDFQTVLNIRGFPNAPEPIDDGDSSSMEISSSSESSQASDHGESRRQNEAAQVAISNDVDFEEVEQAD